MSLALGRGSESGNTPISLMQIPYGNAFSGQKVHRWPPKKTLQIARIGAVWPILNRGSEGAGKPMSAMTLRH